MSKLFSSLVHILNLFVEDVGGLILYLNLICIVIISLGWLVYVVCRLKKGNKDFKIKLKSKSSTPAYIWANSLRNHETNTKINQFLIAICLNECVYILSILFSESAGQYLSSYNSTRPFLDYIEIRYRFRTGFVFYHSLNNLPLRGLNTLITVLLFSFFSLIRILTQYLVSLYSYYQFDVKLKPKLSKLICFIIVLAFLGLVHPLVLFHYLGIVLAVIYEFVLIIIETRKLRLLLKQHLDDARNHENHSVSVVYYYKTKCREYKNFSTILLIAFSFQTISFTIYCWYPIIMTILSNPCTWYRLFFYGANEDIHINLKSHPGELIMNSLVCTGEEALFTLGTFLQILSSIIVLVTRIYHKMKKMKRAKIVQSEYNSLMRYEVERNQAAYAQVNLL